VRSDTIMREVLGSRMIVDADLAPQYDLPRRSGLGLLGASLAHIPFRDRSQSIRKFPRRLPTLYHFHSVGVERVIDDPLGSV